MVPPRTSAWRLCRIVAVALLSLLTSCKEATEPERVPSSIQLDQTTASVDDGQTLKLNATVYDQNSRAFESLPAGVTIQWSSNNQTIASVDGSGLVSGNRPGAARVTATAAGVSARAEITVRAVPTTLAASEGSGQNGSAGAALAQPVVARVTDRHGGGVSGVAVEFVVTAGGGSVAAAQVATDASGDAQTVWTLGATAGDNRLEARAASLSGSPAVFQATAADALSPIITGVTPNVLTPGITATIAGGNFSGVAAGNVVHIDGVAAPVTQASSTQLTIAVPQRGAFRCEPTRDVAVSVTVGSQPAATLQHTLQVATQHSLGVGQSISLLDAADVGCNELAATGGRYVISVFNTSTALSAVAPFQLRGADGSSAPVQPVPAPLAAQRPFTPPTLVGAAGQGPHPSPDAHHQVLEANLELFRRLGPPPSRTQGEVAAQALAIASVPRVGDVITIRVPDYASGNTCRNYREVRARAVYSGQLAVVLEDTAAPLAAQMDNLYQEIGQEYEQVMHPILLANFGNPLAFNSQLSNNGRIYMLFTKLVNDFNLGGFVAGADLYPRSTCASSDQTEIFYGIVPTNGASGFGSGTRDSWKRFMRSTTIHEVKHIVSFVERLSRAGYNSVVWEDSWLEEATARHSEELYARRIFGYGQNGNTTYQSSIYCEVRPSWPECAGRPSAMLSHYGALYDYYSRIEELTPLGRTREGDWTFYGSGWSLVRWAVDQQGGSEPAFLRALVQEHRLSGVANLQARTGKSWAEMLADWTLAMAVDDYPGFTPARAQLRLPSWNTRDIFAGLNRDFPTTYSRVFPLASRTVGFGNFIADVTGVRAGSAAIFELSGATTRKQLIELRSAAGDAPAPTLRMAIVRVQ